MTIETDIPKYAPPAPVDLPDREWPSRRIDRSPRWCSVDLRDGNQALPNPMRPDQKRQYFDLLCRIGFPEIEVAFPSASQDDFDFTRSLVDAGVPGGVRIMGLTQCREHLIARTLEAFEGAREATVHAYIATSPLHMRHVFRLSPEETIRTAVRATEQIRAGAEAAEAKGTDLRMEFSPEEFTDSDPAFVLEICQAVHEAWGRASREKPLTLNLPATVERRPPNEYADMIEHFCRRIPHRETILVSVHGHNDQGMAAAGTELSILAGADRVEGTLFGHGERTGNTDLVTVANNFASRGIETGLDFSNLPEIIETVERLTGMKVYYRQPYAGEYVFTAFSGSHQDAIRKGMHDREHAAEYGMQWKVPYLHVDPEDLGRRYEHLIRINSQSGKGGIAWVLEEEYGLEIPKAMLPELGAAVQRYSDEVAREVTGEEVHRVFRESFVDPEGPYALEGYWPRPDDSVPTQIHGEIRIRVEGEAKTVSADGNGPVSAFVHGMRELGAEAFTIEDYHEQAVGRGADAQAMAYVPLQFADGSVVFGVGSDTNIDQAAVRAIIAGLNRRATRTASA